MPKNSGDVVLHLRQFDKCYFRIKTFFIIFRITVLPDGSLRILNASKADEGRYVCQGENVFGSAEITASVFVKGKAQARCSDPKMTSTVSH